MRPMFYAYPYQRACWDVHDQYILGDALLVAPVMQAGQERRRVYLPQGVKWIDAFNGNLHDGGVWVEYAANLETIPVFVRKDASDSSTLATQFMEAS